MNIVTRVPRRVPVEVALISVFDKTGLPELVRGLVEANSNIVMLSTGGTYRAIEAIQRETPGGCLMEVVDYTGFAEMPGGLVKTLHPKIHAGLLAEADSSAHDDYLASIKAARIDLVCVNLYPFEKVTADPTCTLEEARTNIDIGGPTMLRAAAKNFHRVAVLSSPDDYTEFLHNLEFLAGATDIEQRFHWAAQTFERTREYDEHISAFMLETGEEELYANYELF